MSEPQDFAGKTAVITGAGSGMGRETVLLLARQGCRVIAVDRNLAGARETAASAQALGATADAYEVDVTHSADVTRTIREIIAKHGPIDAAASLAGAYDVRPVEAIDDANWAFMMGTNFYGMANLCSAVLLGMIERRSGAIVNMSSIHALRGQTSAAAYAAAKSAVIGYTRSIAREKGPLGIRANAVAPGPINTPLWRAGRVGDVLARDMIERAKVIPLGRLGEPAEVAQMIVFLLGPRSSYITGQVFNIDGGEVMS
ncbi:MAG: SDR family NAD(P)-dependent oxidoreductase [Burkholderiales bacterium]